MGARCDCFVTATDTGVGKTWISAGLMHAIAGTGRRVVGMKPVASGCRRTRDGWRNEDAEMLQSLATLPQPYDLVNPVALPDAVAPHIAAARADKPIDLSLVRAAYSALRQDSEAVVVEGVGGWRVPLVGNETVADLAVALGLPVVLVVGLRLGCINHALLSASAIVADGATFAGWVANHLQPDYAEAQEIINDLSERIAAPLIGEVPHLQQFLPDRIAGVLAIDLLQVD